MKEMTRTFILGCSLLLLSCSKPADQSTVPSESDFVIWPISQRISDPGFIPATETKAVLAKLAARSPTKGQFETTEQFNARVQKATLVDNIDGFDITKRYLFSTLAEWTYDADSQTLTLSADFSDYEQVDLGTYEASNAFGAKVTVRRTVTRWIYQHFSLPGEVPCSCYDRKTETPLGLTRHQTSCSDENIGYSHKIELKVPPERAKHLPKYVQVLTVEGFDTRDLIRTGLSRNVCLFRDHSETTSPTISDPRDDLTLTTDLNARLYRLIIRNDESGDILEDIDYTSNKVNSLGFGEHTQAALGGQSR
ncbi:MAG TPA: hypothetical protein VII56_08165 [Rhizomicrobium sp.]